MWSFPVLLLHFGRSRNCLLDISFAYLSICFGEVCFRGDDFCGTLSIHLNLPIFTYLCLQVIINLDDSKNYQYNKQMKNPISQLGFAVMS